MYKNANVANFVYYGKTRMAFFEFTESPNRCGSKKIIFITISGLVYIQSGEWQPEVVMEMLLPLVTYFFPERYYHFWISSGFNEFAKFSESH